MENFNKETGVLTVGKTQFMVGSMGNFTKATFKEEYAGKLSADIDLVWTMIEKGRAMLTKQVPVIIKKPSVLVKPEVVIEEKPKAKKAKK